MVPSELQDYPCTHKACRSPRKGRFWVYANHIALPGLSPGELVTTCLKFGAIHISNKINGKPNERERKN